MGETESLEAKREMADAWWLDSARDRTGIAFRHATAEELPEHEWLGNWWASLPDERAVRVHDAEASGRVDARGADAEVAPACKKPLSPRLSGRRGGAAGPTDRRTEEAERGAWGGA